MLHSNNNICRYFWRINKSCCSFFKRITYLFIALFIFQITSLAQDLENIGKQKPFQIHGGLGFNYTGTYTNDSNRVPMPSFWSASLNLNASVYGISIPFSAVLTNGKFSASNSFSRFGLSPRYKWITAHLGYRQYDYSPFTVTGQSFLGGGIELRPWYLRMGLFGGKLRNAFEVDSSKIFEQNIPGSYPLNITTEQGVNYYSQKPSYMRKGWGAKLGFGKESNFVDFIFFKGYDVSSSLKQENSTLHLSPEENVVLGLNIFQRFAKHFSISVNGAASIYTMDATADLITDDFPMKNIITGIIPITIATEFQWATEANFNVNYPNFSINTAYKRIQPNFKSMGISSYLTDLNLISIQPSWSLWKQKIRFMNVFQYQSDNLNGYKQLTSKRTMLNSSVSMNLSNNFGIDFNFNRNSLTQEKSKASVPDSIQASQKSNSITVTPHYIFTTDKISNVTSIVTSYTSMKNRMANNQNNNIQNLYATINNALVVLSSGWNFNGGVNFNSAETSLNSLQSYGFIAGVTKSVFKNSLTLTNSNTLLWNVLDGNQNGNTFSVDLSGAYNFLKNQSINLSINYLYSPANGVYNISDFNQTRIMLGYNYNF